MPKRGIEVWDEECAHDLETWSIMFFERMNGYGLKRHAGREVGEAVSVVKAEERRLAKRILEDEADTLEEIRAERGKVDLDLKETLGMLRRLKRVYATANAHRKTRRRKACFCLP